ncbi:hypothetical protein H8958_006120 [Nasalis larvatus]
MMPGETHSAAPGTAADLSRCQGCASLQQFFIRKILDHVHIFQYPLRKEVSIFALFFMWNSYCWNLNEYVEALITLKQKIINTEENSTLHHQVEEMLQKISPLQKCQEELGSLKAELEEKKSSLKLYQDTHQEYARVKEECLKSDAHSKVSNLSLPVASLDLNKEAAVKQTQDFKQLRNEKKILEKEFKKTQERLDEFSKQKNEKELRHIGTQISSDSYGSIDKSSLFAALGIRNKQGSRSGHLSKGDYSVWKQAFGALTPSDGITTPGFLTFFICTWTRLDTGCAEETFFGEYADSSDNDSVQLRNSAESVSEDDTAESQNYFGSLRKSKGSGTWEEKLKSHEAIQALNTWEVNKVTTAGLETFTATLRESSATHSLVGEKHWTTASRSMSDRKRDILHETKTQMEVREMDKSVQTEKTVRKLTRGLCIERVSASPAQEKEAAPRKSELCSSHLGKRPLNELMESEGKIPLSKMIGSPKSEFTKWTRINEITSEPDCITVSGHFHGLSRELEKEKEDTQGFCLGESPESEDDDSGDAMDVAGLDFETSFSSSSTLVALSVGSNPQSSSRLDCGNDPDITTKVFSTEPPHSEHKLHTKTLNTLHLQSEPPECSIGRNTLENSLRALSPELGASSFNEQKSSGIEDAKVVKDLTKIHSLPRSVFMKATKDGQCESQDPRIELTLNKPDFTSLIGSQAALIKSGLGFVKSTSWHHSDLLRKGGEESLKAKSEHEQKTSQLQKAMPSLQNRGPTPKPNLLKENSSPVEFKTTASVLPNQVSVITKQTRTEKVQSAKLEHLRPHRNEPTLVTENNGNKTSMSTIAKCAGERDDTTQNVREVAAVQSISPEVSASRRKLDFNCAGGSSPVENSDCSTNSRVSFSSENILVQNQDIVREAVVQGDGQKQRQPQATDLDSSGTDGSEVLPATEVTMSGGFSVEKTSCGDTGRSGGEALAVANDSTSTSQNANGLWKLKSTTPGGALLECFGTADTTFSSAFWRKGETQDTSQSSLPGTLHCYTGIREGGDDTEVEESEAFSCSEGSEQQDPPDDSQKNSGDTDAGVAEVRPSLEVGYLTSALQDFNISTFSELDRLSTSEVVMFLESCQLGDYSSGDSVSECSSKGTLNKEMNKELKPSEIAGEKYRKQPCEEETLGTCEEWIESEEDDYLLKNTSQLTQCSLETLSEVLTKIRQELQTNAEDCNGKDTGSLLLLNINNNLTTESLKEKSPFRETTGSSSHASEPAPQTAALDTEGSSPIGGRPQNENTESRPEASADAGRQTSGGKEVLPEPVEPSALCSDSVTQPSTEQSSNCEAETTFQCQIATVTSEVINVLINKDQNLVIEKGDNWTIISGVAVLPHVDQVTLCDFPGDIPISQAQGELEAGCIPVTSAEKSPEASHTGPAFQEVPCGNNLSCPQEDVSSTGQSTNFDKSRLRNRPVKPSIWISSQIYDQNFETQIVASDHTYYNSKLEPSGKNKNRSKVSNKDQSNKPVKTSASSRVETHQNEVAQSFSGEKANTKTQRSQTQTILANADTSTPTDCSPDTLSKIRQEVGPPLPPLLAPLIATPPRTSQPLSPLISSSSPSSPTSPVGQISPLCETPVPPVMSPWPEDPRRASPLDPSPSPSAVSASERVVSSPLQFCAATPKHALPVPGRLPPCASGHAAVGGPQENSVKILDTMYPELSARARTLNILKGNIQLTRGPSADCKNLPGPASAMIGFKTITSAATAFVKTGSSSGGDCNQNKSRDLGTQQDSAKIATTDAERSCSSPAISAVSQLPLSPKETVESHDKAIANALKKIAEFSFDLLPVIRSHVYVGNISKKPVMRDQEKEVVYEFSTTKKNAPVDVGFMVSKLLLTIQLCPKTEFQSSEKFGEDLSDNTWEYIFAIDLLCCHQKWIWTHDNIISKELWPVMDKWIKYRKGHANIAYTPDIIIASILRLIGRLGQLGLKEGFPSAVKNISSVIDIPWGIQLAAVYALCDLSPSNPAEISKILEAWRREASKSVPSAIVSCLEEVSALSTEELG